MLTPSSWSVMLQTLLSWTSRIYTPAPHHLSFASPSLQLTTFSLSDGKNLLDYYWLWQKFLPLLSCLPRRGDTSS